MADHQGALASPLKDTELLKRYRLDQAKVLFVIDMVRDALESPTGRSAALGPEMKIVITLCYLPTSNGEQEHSYFSSSAPSRLPNRKHKSARAKI
ncbi:hypothetical protein E2C01_096511 [Portunus trituberculatus]|uniref:Uncharacterized protein n=1 Tax=Portunus trituberculatus TaxID=210409 RepID=A0A5B7JVT7_PORTR|nr:hypothetical protein [Portunus trituberculatus]